MGGHVGSTSFIALLIIGAFLFVEIQLLSTDNIKVPLSKMTEAFHDWRLCMETQLDTIRQKPVKMWLDFPSITTFCRTTTDIRRIEHITLRNNDDVKHFILSKDGDPSVTVTLGVGTDIGVERQLQDLLPEGSEFFGADPVAMPNAEIFSRIGTFFPFAISNHSGLSYSTIRTDNGDHFVLISNNTIKTEEMESEVNVEGLKVGSEMKMSKTQIMVDCDTCTIKLAEKPGRSRSLHVSDKENMTNSTALETLLGRSLLRQDDDRWSLRVTEWIPREKSKTLGRSHTRRTDSFLK